MQTSLRTSLVILALGLISLLPRAAFAATLYFDPETVTYGPGDTFIATVRLDNGKDCINAVNVAISYPTNTLRAVDFSTGDSIFSLWAVEPKIDTEKGTVVFAGGIPGGYCGRIAGDPALTNILGKVVFTVIATGTPTATIAFAPASAAYLNDGQGSPATLATRNETVTLSSKAKQDQNPWLAQVGADTNPPQPFVVQVQSTDGVFGGKYYVVFATTDKESGLDHFEILEKGVWNRITSPYLLKDQFLLSVGDVKIRAIDKAGNIRMGTYNASSTPLRRLTIDDFMPFIILGVLLILVLGIMVYEHRKKRASVA